MRTLRGGEVPVPGSVRDRLLRAGVERFAAAGYRGVGVVDLAAAAGVTTGALYHHFRAGKAELYRHVRRDVEQRAIDRMRGAADAMASSEGSDPVRAALLVGYDYAIRQSFARLLSEASPQPGDDPIAALLDDLLGASTRPLGEILAAAWRAALASVARGGAPDAARHALRVLTTVPADR